MREQFAGIWWVGSGRELSVLVTAKTSVAETRKPAAFGSMLLVCPIEITDTRPIRRK